MQVLSKNTSNKSKALVEKVVNKMEGLKKPRKKFMISLLILYLSLRGRYTFKGLERYGGYCEKSYRLHFEQHFDFLGFNIELSQQHLSTECIVVFDPSYLPKSGKHTPHIGKFWSGCLGKAIKGIEIGGLGVVDVESNTAFNLEAIQTPAQEILVAKDQSLVDHYAKVIIDRQDQLTNLSRYLVVDAYFTKIKFVDAIRRETSLHLISKLRKDANLKYLFTGVQKEGRGRPRQYAGKINLKKIDRRRFRQVYKDEQVVIHQIICYSVGLKRKTNVAHVQFVGTNRFALFYSTDFEMEATQVYKYYKARFQIEFLFRDAKQHTGLTHAQSRSENKLYFHFNASLAAVNVAKAAHYLNLEKEQRNTFSMTNVKTSYFNKLMLNLFLSNFQIQPNLTKNKSIINKILSFGRIAA